MKYKLVIFDWDGTVMDSVGRIVSSMQNAARIINCDVPSDHDVKSIIGLSLEKAVAILFPQQSVEQHQSLILHYRKQYKEDNSVPTPYFSGVAHVLSTFKQQDVLLAVATGKGRQGLERVWGDYKEYFSISRCSDDAQSKPHPEMIEQILTALNIEKSEAVMVGDSIHDLAMANSAGVDSIGVTYGVHSEQELQVYNPIAVIDSFEEILTVTKY
ncbi:HAD-IA family hydrolase [Flocculibacter collagenilyticus]|uniref:HAD-IA family hydrolase n=1 Tax=Flocculibacter collagenilyticus TaxID=2744479 RepID=UPI0018F6382C|nr:HAD-IA family hydrolase [Flocculibacter collagenilyticus]